MNSKIFLFLGLALFFQVTAGAQDADPKKIRELTRTIVEKYKMMGKNLVLLSYARALGDNLDFQKIEETRSGIVRFDSASNSIQGSVADVQSALYPVLFSTEPVARKEDELKKLFLTMEKNLYSWQKSAFSVHQVRDQILAQFKMNLDFCSNEGYGESLKYLDFNAPELFKFTDLTMDQELGINLHFDDNGTYNNSNVTYLVDNDNQTKQMVSYGLAATAATAYQIIEGGSMAGPAGTKAAAIAAAVYIVVKTSWDIYDVRKHNKVMKEVYKANQELFANLNLDVQVRNAYMDTCRSLVRPYLEARPLVQDLLANESAPDQQAAALEKIEKTLKELEKDGPYDTEQWGAKITEDEKHFERFFKFHLFNKIKSIYNLMEGSQELKNEFVSRYIDFKNELYHSLEEMYLVESPSLSDQTEVSFATYFKAVQSLETVRSDFQKLVFDIMNTEDKSLREQMLIEAENLLAAHEVNAKFSSTERTQFLSMARDTLLKLQAL